ncbi:MAG: hypothetical protein IJT97_01580 [Bacteroidaceae bacterium]|nr:hypothetical protein [Bacteroidaceae bacterium]
MKNLNLTGLMMALLVCLLTLCACGSDDEKNTNGNGNGQSGQVADGLDQRLLGTWTCIVSEGWEYNADGVVLVHWKDLSAISTERWEYDDQGNEVSHNTYNEPDKPEWEMTTFYADGTFSDITEEGQKPKGSWQAAGGVLTVTVSGKSSVKKYSFNGNTLVIVSEEYEEEGGKRYLASKTVDNFERGTFNGETNTVNPNGGGNGNSEENESDTPDSQFDILGVWRSYKATVAGSDEVYYVQGENDGAYAVFEFSAGGVAKYSFWDSGEDDGNESRIRYALRKAVRKAATQFVSIPLSYTVNGNSVKVFSSQSVSITLNFDASEQALVLSTPVVDELGVTYTTNIYFRK